MRVLTLLNNRQISQSHFGMHVLRKYGVIHMRHVAKTKTIIGYAVLIEMDNAVRIVTFVVQMVIINTLLVL